MGMSTEVWQTSEQDFPEASSIEAQLRFLLRYAILAPSPQNSQPWVFAVRENQVHLMADLARGQPVSDPEGRELYLSLGCALENLLVAAEHFGFAHAVSYFPQQRQPQLVATVLFRPGGKTTLVRSGATLNAILRRHNDPGLFSPAPIPESVRRSLEACCNDANLALDLTDDYRFRNWIEALTATADRIDFANPGFRMELAHWARHGAFSAAVGSRPPALPEFGPTLVETIAIRSQAKVESSPMLGLIRATGDSHLTHVRAGQLFQRVWLTATAAGVNVNPMSQTMRRPELRSVVAMLSPYPGWVPQHVFRLGYSLTLAEHRTPRRGVDDVML
jgi:hypothetical protein